MLLVRKHQVCLCRKDKKTDSTPLGIMLGASVPRSSLGSAGANAMLSQERCITCSRSVQKGCCYLALVALSKEFVLVHGLHKRLDGVDKGKPSAVDLHDQQDAIEPKWVRLAGKPHRQQCACFGTMHARCRTDTLQVEHSKMTAVSSYFAHSCTQVFAHHIDTDDEPVESKDDCRHTIS